MTLGEIVILWALVIVGFLLFWKRLMDLVNPRDDE